VQSLVENFIQDAAKYGRNFENEFIQIYFVSGFDDVNVVGMCYYSSNRISIKKSFWDQATKSTRHQVLYHELGHCWLKQQHRERSIMNKYIIPDIAFDIYYEDFLVEMFTYSPFFLPSQ
jgi:hypothetical protein